MEHSFYKLSAGAELFNSLNELNTLSDSTSFLKSAAWDLSKVEFKCPFNEKTIIIEKKLEIITLTGYLASKDSHLHISVSDSNCNVFEGHLLPGTIVLKLLDILFGAIPNLVQQSKGSAKISNSTDDIYVLLDCAWSNRAFKLLDLYHIKYNCFLISSDDIL